MYFSLVYYWPYMDGGGDQLGYRMSYGVYRGCVGAALPEVIAHWKDRRRERRDAREVGDVYASLRSL